MGDSDSVSACTVDEWDALAPCRHPHRPVCYGVGSDWIGFFVYQMVSAKKSIEHKTKNQMLEVLYEKIEIVWSCPWFSALCHRDRNELFCGLKFI